MSCANWSPVTRSGRLASVGTLSRSSGAVPSSAGSRRPQQQAGETSEELPSVGLTLLGALLAVLLMERVQRAQQQLKAPLQLLVAHPLTYKQADNKLSAPPVGLSLLAHRSLPA